MVLIYATLWTFLYNSFAHESKDLSALERNLTDLRQRAPREHLVAEVGKGLRFRPYHVTVEKAPMSLSDNNISLVFVKNK